MALCLLFTPSDLQAYREWLKTSPEASLWQSLEWRGYEEALGRETRLYGLKSGSGALRATALVVIDRTTFSLSTWDIPRGPLGLDAEARSLLLTHIVAEAKRYRCMALYFSPPNHLPICFRLKAATSPRTEQPGSTLTIDLTQSDEELLTKMHEKGRYNIRLAQKHGVKVEEGRDIDAFYELLCKTAQRDRFRVLPKAHYECFLRDLPGSFLLLAYPPTTSQPIAGLLGMTWEETGYYYYGASDYESRALMAPYLLQWEAMKRCRERGCEKYDLLGIELPGAAMNRGAATGSWAGITRFKRQFGGKVKTYPPEQTVVLRPVFKALIEWKRKILG